MAHPPQPGGMTIDGHVVGRVGKNEIGRFALHQCICGFALASVAADEAMPSKQPQLARSTHRGIAAAKRRDMVLRLCRPCGSTLAGFVEDEIDLSEREAGKLDLELQVDQPLQFECEQFPIPAGILRKLVVGKHIGAPLGTPELRQPQRRNSAPSEMPGGLDAAMSSDDLVIVADQHRIGKAEPLDTSGDLPDLFAGMGAGIARIRLKLVNGHSFNGHGSHGRDCLQFEDVDRRLMNSRDATQGNAVTPCLSRHRGSGLADCRVRPPTSPFSSGCVRYARKA
jgi:hypothetical protein